MITGEELAAYAAGEADPALVARVESALPGDTDLVARLARLRELDEALAGLGPVAMTADEAARLTSAVDLELARLAEGSASEEAAATGAAATGGDVVDLAGHRAARDRRTRRSRGAAVREWFDPMRLAGVAAALVVVVGVATLVANGFGGGDDALESVGEAARVEAGGDQSEALMPLPTGTAEAIEEMTEAAAADGSTETAMGAAGATPIPIIDDQRVVPEADDIDPTVLRQRLEPLVDLGAIDEPAEDEAGEETAAVGEPDAVGIADGRVTEADAEVVDACLPTDLPVIVAEVIVLAPARAAVAYVLADRVLVVDAVTCGTVAELLG